MTKEKRKNIGLLIGLAAALCVIIVLVLWSSGRDDDNFKPTLPGAAEIYPTVMVNGKLYEWSRTRTTAGIGAPEGYEYYGELRHIEGDTPVSDGDFVSAFDVTGGIYIHPEREGEIYLCLTTEWMDNTAVPFDLVQQEN